MIYAISMAMPYSQASNESGFVELMLSYKTNMDLTYLEMNEKIDRITDRLPAGIDRPRVVWDRLFGHPANAGSMSYPRGIRICWKS